MTAGNGVFTSNSVYSSTPILALQSTLYQPKGITVDYVDYDFVDAADAWAAQVAGPHAKITARLR
jgi:hypothetical protein